VAGAKYKQIADNLREQISSGTLRPGDQLPTEPQLATAFDASRSTIRLAIGVLAANGLIETRQGMGTFVRRPAAPRTVLLTREEDWQAGEHTDAALQPTGDGTDRPVTARFLAETANANAEIAAALHVAEGARVLVRRSQLRLDQEPWSLVASYYPMDLASGTPLEQAGTMEKSASLVLAELGHRPSGYRDDIYARMPDPAEAEFFQLASVAPVTVVRRTAYDASRPIRLTMYVYRADQVRLRHEMGSIPQGNDRTSLHAGSHGRRRRQVRSRSRY
jgi:GntR family transcriptional regulator